MIKRRHSTSLARASFQDEDVNPNSYVNNIADCMLVLVLGFLVALIARYGVDLQAPVEDETQMTGIEVNMDADDDGKIDDNYQQRGSVYYDADSGNYYYVADEAR